MTLWSANQENQVHTYASASQPREAHNSYGCSTRLSADGSFRR